MNAPGKEGQLQPEQVLNPMSLPVISRKRFAELSGVPDGVIQGWIQRGYIPTYTIGKHTLINLALLNQMALNKAPWL